VGARTGALAAGGVALCCGVAAAAGARPPDARPAAGAARAGGVCAGERPGAMNGAIAIVNAVTVASAAVFVRPVGMGRY
jgi:hypothetical protein